MANHTQHLAGVARQIFARRAKRKLQGANGMTAKWIMMRSILVWLGLLVLRDGDHPVCCPGFSFKPQIIAPARLVLNPSSQQNHDNCSV